MELRPGNRIDRYELVAPIADGGMGSVWLARMKRSADFERLFALKTVLPHYAADAGFRKMFLDETRIASAISHANVAAILDVGEEAGRLYMVMEWVDGDSLHVLTTTVEANGGKVPTGIALRVIADACSGLHAVHEARDRTGKPLEIVHRDLSPHNVLITTHGQAKLIDFGVARARDRLADTTSEGSLKGKVRYLSPEYAAGGPIDRRSDIWGVGAVLYRLIEGRSPIEAENNYAVLRMLLERTPPEPMSEGVPRPLEAVIMKCLRVDKGERYATADEVHRALEAAMIEMSMSATSGDVAAYLEKHLGELAFRRRTTIEMTLAQLDEATPGVVPETPAPLSGRSGSATLAAAGGSTEAALAITGLSATASDTTILLAGSLRAIRTRQQQRIRLVMQGLAGMGLLLVAAAVGVRYVAGGPASATSSPAEPPALARSTGGLGGEARGARQPGEPVLPAAVLVADAASAPDAPVARPAPTGTSAVVAPVDAAPSASAPSRKKPGGAPVGATPLKHSDVFDERR